MFTKSKPNDSGGMGIPPAPDPQPAARVGVPHRRLEHVRNLGEFKHLTVLRPSPLAVGLDALPSRESDNAMPGKTAVIPSQVARKNKKNA